MQFGRPIWNSIWAGFLLRLPLGAYFFFAGRLKLQNIEGFVAEVKKYHVIPDQLATLYAVMLPYLEIIAGVLLIVGLWTTLASIVISALLVSFIIALGVHPDNPKLFNKDIILLGHSLALLCIGAGAFSIDNFRAKG
jgi:uncharacterized membrane protein YphA (DoxX/SURF4 family)